MADKLTELQAALEGMSNEGLKLVLEFAKFLAKNRATLPISGPNRES